MSKSKTLFSVLWLSVGLALFSCAPVFAATPSAANPAKFALSWTIPTARANGAPLAASELAGYTITATQQETGRSKVYPVAGGATTSATIADFATEPGVYVFTMTATDTAGLISAQSAAVSRSVIPPNAPGGLSVSVSVTITVPAQ